MKATLAIIPIWIFISVIQAVVMDSTDKLPLWALLIEVPLIIGVGFSLGKLHTSIHHDFAKSHDEWRLRRYLERYIKK